jgi:fibronectin-binding autotransporter adhesin
MIMQRLQASAPSPRFSRLLLASVVAAVLTVGLPAIAEAADPANVTPPAVTPAGPAAQGSVLSVAPGTWDASVTTPSADVWSDCSAANVCTTSSASTYTVPSDEPAHTIFVTETATDSATSSTATATSNLVTVVEPPSNSTLPSISGTAAQGQALTANPGSWANSPTFSYAWQDCLGSTCNPSPTSTNSTTYTVTAADAVAGFAIRVAVTGANADGSVVANSPSTAAVTGVPADTGLPTITGTAAGGTLTEVHGAWTNVPTAFTYQWLSCTSSSASTCTAISGATAQTYAVPVASDGLGYEVQETASNISGAGTAATSAVLIPAPPVNTVLPAVTGTVALGQVLTASTGTWSNGPTAYAYQWQRCSGSPLVCNAISGATVSTYTLTSQDAGFTTEVQVTATNAGGSASISSAGSALPSPPALRAGPSISGTAEQGQTLTEIGARWVVPPALITRQWYLCDSSTNDCAAIAGATAQSYVPTAADVGGYVQVLETASNAGGSASTYSPFAGPVMPLQGPILVPVSSSPPAIVGSTQQGATIVETHGAWTGNPGTFSYQWLRCQGGCSPVPGATGQTYTLGPGDVGFSLKVQETASNSGGPGNPATSAAAAVVTATSSTGLVAPQRSVTNQQVTLIATVTSSSANALASGSVSFRSASGPITGCGAVQTNATGQSATVTCQTSFATGIVRATAVFSASGGSLLTGSGSQASTISVGTAPTVTHLTAPGQASVRSTLKYTASVAPKSTPAAPIRPSGTLTFLDRGKAIHGCSDRRLVKSSASCQVRYTGLGSHRITARYAGDADFAVSTSAVGRVTVGKQSPSYVTSVMQWYVHFTPSYTRFTSWLAYGVPAASSLYFTCHGNGCPFATHTLAVANSTRCTAKGKTKQCPASRTVNLEPVFSGVRLAVGTTVTVSILRCGWYGKHYTLKIRSRRGPSSVISNLPIGVTRPGVKC